MIAYQTSGGKKKKKRNLVFEHVKQRRLASIIEA